MYLSKDLGNRSMRLALLHLAYQFAQAQQLCTRFGPLLFRQRLRPLAHDIRQRLLADPFKAAHFPFDEVVGNRPQRHDVIQVPEEPGQPRARAVADLLTHAGAGVAKSVQAFVGWVVGALQFLQVLNRFEVVNLVFHVAANGFPVADGERQTGALEFEAGEGFTVVEADAHTVLAVNAVLGGALGFDDPGGERFPWDEDRFGFTFGHEADFAALTVEAGWDD